MDEFRPFIIDGGLWIIVDGMFEGTIYQFRDCFFSNATPDLIFDWARENDCTCHITWKYQTKDIECVGQRN